MLKEGGKNIHGPHCASQWVTPTVHCPGAQGKQFRLVTSRGHMREHPSWPSQPWSWPPCSRSASSALVFTLVVSEIVLWHDWRISNIKGSMHFLLSCWLSPSCPFAKSDLCKGNQHSSHLKEPLPHLDWNLAGQNSVTPAERCSECWGLALSVPDLELSASAFWYRSARQGPKSWMKGNELVSSRKPAPSSFILANEVTGSQFRTHSGGQGDQHAFSFSLEWLKEFSSGKRNLKDWFLWVWDKLTLLKWASSWEMYCCLASSQRFLAFQTLHFAGWRTAGVSVVNVVYVVICGQSLLERWCLVMFHLLIPEGGVFVSRTEESIRDVSLSTGQVLSQTFQVLKPESHENLDKSMASSSQAVLIP